MDIVRKVVRYGFTNSFAKLSHSLFAKSYKRRLVQIESSNSSITDSSRFVDYQDFCLESSQGNLYQRFRRGKPIIEALDHVSYTQATEMIKFLGGAKSISADHLVILKELDEIRNPFRFRFHGIGWLSPTMIRYYKIAIEINSLFSIDKRRKLHVAEIGVGFGGQLALLCRLFPESIERIHMYDLPPVLQLASRFLEDAKVTTERVLLDGRNPKQNLVDLAISNYAFSECSYGVQQSYLKNVLSSAGGGYMILNNLSHTVLDGASAQEIQKQIPKSKLIPELPITNLGNELLVW